MDEPVPQAVLAPLTTSAIFLVITIDPGGEPIVRELLPDLSGLTRAVGFRATEDGLTCVTGIGSAAWDRLFDAPRPAELHPFEELHGPTHTAPATPGDLLFHIRAFRMDLCFELAAQIMSRLRGAVTVQDETQGFRYFEERDLLGFVDGTENPVGPEAAAAALNGDGESYVIVQKYLHDLASWDTLTTEQQELAVGRTKLADIELADDVKPGNSHVTLNTVTDEDGNDLDILRCNMPFGSPGGGEFGTYFIGYCATPAVTELMLRNMFIGVPPGNHDRLLDFSTAVTGTLFHVPTVDFLDDPPPPPATTSNQQTKQQTLPAGSLGIGDLKRSIPR